MIDFRPIALIIGTLLMTLGGTMTIPALFDLAAGSPDWIVFTTSALVTTFVGMVLWAASRGRAGQLSLRGAFVMTVLTWVALAVFGALPIYWAGLEGVTVTDALFESVSGLTTTGATVLTGLDGLPPGILLWRSLLQWLGGLGIVVMAIAVLPMLKVGGMQLFKAEAFDTPEKILPRATQISGQMTLIYIMLTFVCAGAYTVAGMDGFDAINHAMTTVATGGMSTRDASMGHFQSPAIEFVAITFMILGSLPFLLYLKIVQTGQMRGLFNDDQVHAFFGILICFALAAWAYQVLALDAVGFTPAREALFNVTSIMTGTGYATANYSAWGAFAVWLFFALTFIGGCAGSTSCGMKVFRFQVIVANIRRHLAQTLSPNQIVVQRFNGRRIQDGVYSAVMNFFFLYMLVFIVVAMLLSMMGLNAITALSASATAISNVGPGLGEIIGPAGNFAALPDTAKWVLSAAMLIGRLELLTVLVLFVPQFWRG